MYERIRHEVSVWQVAPIHASLFGSFARGEANAASDIDVLLVHPSPLDDTSETAWSGQVDDLDRKIRSWTGNAAHIVDPTAADPAQMAHAKDPVVDSWRADCVHLDGERLLDLLRRDG